MENAYIVITNKEMNGKYMQWKIHLTHYNPTTKSQKGQNVGRVLKFGFVFPKITTFMMPLNFLLIPCYDCYSKWDFFLTIKFLCIHVHNQIQMCESIPQFVLCE